MPDAAAHLLSERRLPAPGGGAGVAARSRVPVRRCGVRGVPVYGSRPFRLREHLDRLNRSLAGIRMTAPMSHAEWLQLCQELIARNSARSTYLYLQVSRGAEFGRNHAWPEGLKPTMFAYVTALGAVSGRGARAGRGGGDGGGTRWARRDIKSTSLLANILLKKLSADAGAFETILLENGELTEGSSTTVHVVKDGVIRTPPNSQRILPGTTRDVVAELAARLGFPARAAASRRPSCGPPTRSGWRSRRAACCR